MGRLRLRRSEVGAEAVADGCDVQLGPVLREARQGRDERNAGSRASTTGRSRTASPASLRTARRSRRRRRRRSPRSGRRSSPASSTCSRARSTTRRGRSWCRRGRRSRSSRISTRCSGSPRASSGRSRRSRLRASSVGQVPASSNERGAGSPGASPASRRAHGGNHEAVPGVVANDGVTFEAAAGEVHALLGENGAGKTTLSNILTGLYRPDEGEIELYGEPVRFHSPRDALDAGIGMVHQHFRLVEPFSVAENVVLGDHRGEGGRIMLRPSATERRVEELERALRARRRARRRRSGSSRSASSSASRS